MIQIKKDKYIINIERVDGTIYIRSSGIVPKNIERIIQWLDKNRWLDEEATKKTLAEAIKHSDDMIRKVLGMDADALGERIDRP